MKKKINIINKFDFLFDDKIFEKMEVNLVMARKTGKTKTAALMMVYYLATHEGFAGLATRLIGSTITTSIMAEINWALNLFGIEVKINLSNKKYVFKNGNELYFRSVKTQSSAQVGFAGFALSYTPKQWIVWEEEAYEYSEEEINLISEAIRGAPALFLKTANPWFADHWYIKRLSEIQPWNKTELIDKTFQKYEDNDKIIMYGTYKINNLLLPSDIRRMEYEAEVNPHRAEVVLWGMPGTLSDTIYGDMLWKAEPVNETILDHYIEYTIGIDFGEISDSTSIVLIANSKNYEKIHVLKEFEYKPPKGRPGLPRDEIADLVNDTIVEWKNELGIKSIQARFDSSAVVFGNRLKILGKADGIYYRPSSKKLIVERIDLVNMLLAEDRLKFFEGKLLRRDMVQSMWVIDKKTGNPINERMDGNDHVLNAFEYALERRHKKYHKTRKGI